MERSQLFLHMEIFEKNEMGLKRRISWVEFSISCQHMQNEQRNSKGSKRQIGWVGSFYPAIWDKVWQTLHVVQCALLWAQFVMKKGLLRQIHAILLCSCLKHIQTRTPWIVRKSDENKSFWPNQSAPSIYIIIELCYFSLNQWETEIHLLWGKCFNIPHWSQASRPMRDSNTLKSFLNPRQE